MNARRFDALTVAMASGTHRASRRRVLRGMAVLTAMGFAPGVAQAFDGGVAPIQVPVGGVACTSGADCAAGEICLNGACAPRDAAGTTTGGAEVTGTTPVAPEGGVGGLIQPGAPLPARIYAGRCGALGAEPAFQLIDVGSVEGVEEGESPQGALTAIPAEFSTTVVNATLADLLGAEFAIDVRVDDADPATSIACGDIGGPVEAGAEGEELAVGLQERGQSAYSGIGWLQGQDDRTVVRVFLARGLEGGATVAAPQAAAEAPARRSLPRRSRRPRVRPSPAWSAPSVPARAWRRRSTSIFAPNHRRTAPVIQILGEGVVLEVTGAPEGGWVPVLEPASGQRGFVSDQFVVVAT